MKKGVLAILICSVLLNIVLAAGYLREKNSERKYEELFYYNARSAGEHFLDYSQNGKNEEFAYAVSDVNIMRQMIFVLDATKDADYIKTHFSELYGQLILHPEKLQLHSSALAAICELLQEDYANQAAAHKIAELLNQMNNE